MAKVSVIVPIYNVERYLETCFDSLLKQSYQDFVIFAVNDGSPDQSKIIMDDYKSKYPNQFVVIHKENGGYGSVLELAINQIETPLFLICDPDDYLASDALEKLVALQEETKASLVIGAKAFIYSDGKDEDYDPSYNKDYVKMIDSEVFLKGDLSFDKLYFVDPSPHAKLYTTNLLLGLKFPKKVGYTDNLLYYYALANANTVAYTSHLCAYYLVDRQGNTMTDLNAKVVDAHVEVFKTIIDEVSKCDNIAPIFYYRMFESYKFIFQYLKRIEASPDELEQRAELVYSLLEKLKPYHSQIFAYYDQYSKSLSNERKKDILLFTPLSKMIYNRNKKQLLQKSDI